MGWKDVFKKIGQVALMEAPFALEAAGLPASLAPAVTGGILAAQSMKGKSNTEKAKIAADIAKIIIHQTNQVLVSKGHPPLLDEDVTDDALAHSVKLTYDLTKAKVEAVGGTMPAPPA